MSASPNIALARPVVLARVTRVVDDTAHVVEIRHKPGAALGTSYTLDGEYVSLELVRTLLQAWDLADDESVHLSPQVSQP